MRITNPQPLDPAEVRSRALAVIQADRICFLATTDGDQPRLRPIAPIQTDGFTIYMVNLHSHDKTRQIAANPKVELCYLDEHQNQVRIAGTAEVVDSPALLQEIVGKRTLLRAYLETIDDSQFLLYCISPIQVRYMQGWATEYQQVPLA